MSGHPAEAGELDAEESAQPMKDVQHNPGDAPLTGVNLEKSRLVGGKVDVWRGSGGTYASGFSDVILTPETSGESWIKPSLLHFQVSSNPKFLTQNQVEFRNREKC